MSFAAEPGVPPSKRMASVFCMSAVNHSYDDIATLVAELDGEPRNLWFMSELKDRLRLAFEAAGYRPGDGPEARKALVEHLDISRMAVSKLFDGTSKNFSAVNLFQAADLLGVNARWLATGEGDMRDGQVSRAAFSAAEALSSMEDEERKRIAIALTHLITKAPPSALIELMAGMKQARDLALHGGTPPAIAATTMGLSDEALEIAKQLDSIHNPEFRRVAIALAYQAAFRPQKPQPLVDPEPQRQPTRKLPSDH